MTLPKFELVRPRSLREAIEALQQGNESAAVLAGGTDLLVRLKQRSCNAKLLVDISCTPGLDEVHSDGEFVRIGAMTRLATVAEDRRVSQLFPILTEAVTAVGAPQHQFMGTIGGNLCIETRCWYFNQSKWWRQAKGICLKAGGDTCHIGRKDKCYAAFCGDVAPALISLDGQLQITGPDGGRKVSAEEFYTGNGLKPNSLRSNEIVTELLVPYRMSSWRGTFVKLRPRGSIDFALVSAAVTLSVQEDRLLDSRVVLGAVGSGPVRVKLAEDIMRGVKFDKKELLKLKAQPELLNFPVKGQVPDWLVEIGEAAVRSARPVKNMAWSPSYRRKMAGVLVQDAVLKLLTHGEPG